MINQLAQYYRGDYPMDYMNGNDSGWFPLVGLVVFVLIVGIILLVVYKIATHSTAASQGKDPLDIAKERLAKGEIDQDQYSAIKKELDK